MCNDYHQLSDRKMVRLGIRKTTPKSGVLGWYSVTILMNIPRLLAAVFFLYN